MQRRVFESDLDDHLPATDTAGGFLDGWLRLAGYRSPGAEAGFLAAQLVLVGTGVTVAYATWASNLLAWADYNISQIPGGLSNMARPLLYCVPWMLLALIASIPMLIVRGTRRRRVSQVERDLPITLELLATLAEGGLGFDAALDRILAAQPPNRASSRSSAPSRPTCSLAGRAVECLRRVAQRLEVTAVTIFISSLVQAEQLGSGLAEVLRTQSDDLRQRRRERAIEFSMALPIKLLFPLVICFLPGILVFTLGPPFYEFFRLADAYAHSHHG